MGNQPSYPGPASMDDHKPPLSEFSLKHSANSFSIWKNNCTSEAMIEYQIYITSQGDFGDQIENFQFRNKHPLLVSTLYWEYAEQPSYIASKISVFYERIYTNLSRIKDIPFNDTLHFYYVALKGFELLYKKFGYFHITEAMFYISDHHKLKIWGHEDISRIRPDKPLECGFEAVMVRKIIQLIDENTDYPPQCIPLGSILYEEASNSFHFALQKLKELTIRYKWTIPERLSCLEQLSKGEVQNILDEYSKKEQRKSRLDGRDSARRSKGLHLSRSYEKQRKSSNSPKQIIKYPPNLPIIRPPTTSIRINQSQAQHPQPPIVYQPIAPKVPTPQQGRPVMMQTHSTDKLRSLSRPASTHALNRKPIVIRTVNNSRERAKSREERNTVGHPIVFNQPNPIQFIPPRQMPKQQSTPSLHQQPQLYDNTPVRKFELQKIPEAKVQSDSKTINRYTNPNPKLFTNESLLAEIQAIRRKYGRKQATEHQPSKGKTHGYFGFGNGKETLVSYNDTQEKENSHVESKIQHKQKKQLPLLPSVTDISHNVSNLNQREVEADKSARKEWKAEHSIVMRHNLSPQKSPVSQSHGRRQQLAYNPAIDEDIWADVLKLRQK